MAGLIDSLLSHFIEITRKLHILKAVFIFLSGNYLSISTVRKYSLENSVDLKSAWRKRSKLYCLEYLNIFVIALKKSNAAVCSHLVAATCLSFYRWMFLSVCGMTERCRRECLCYDRFWHEWVSVVWQKDAGMSVCSIREWWWRE